MKADLHKQWQHMRQQWQDNPRLRILAAVVVVILLVSLLQSLHQLQGKARQDSQRQWQRLQDVRQLSQEHHWQDYAAHTTQALNQLEQRLWHAASEGQAQAQLRDVLQQTLNRHGLKADRINITSLPTDDGELLQVRADVSGDYHAGPWQEFVHEVSTRQPAIFIEHDSINRSNPRRNHYRIGLHAWFVLGEEP